MRPVYVILPKKKNYFSKSFTKNGAWKLAAGHILLDFFGKNFPFVISHKRTKFHCQTVFTSEVIQ